MREDKQVQSGHDLAARIDSEIPLDDEALKKFFIEVKGFLNRIETDNIEAVHKKNRKISSQATFEFFRSQQRLINTKRIVQYLLSFLSKIPSEEDIKKEITDPFEQFRQFLTEYLKLLKDKDVRTAILKEHEQLGLLNDNNLWYYRGRIDSLIKEGEKVLSLAVDPVFKDYRLLFMLAQKLSKFWFTLRGEQLTRIRRSDIYIYKLSGILIERIDSSTNTK